MADIASPVPATSPIVVGVRHRFAAAERQWTLQRRGAQVVLGVPNADLREARAIDLARFWESFPGSYTVEQVDAGVRIIVAAAAGPVPAGLVELAHRLEGCC